MSERKFNLNWRYAIGEFLIIVLGIIAAFQVDNWKGERENKRLLIEYLTDLNVSLQTDSMYFNNATKYFDNMAAQIDSTQQFLQAGQRELPSSGQKSIRNLSDWYHTYISNAAFEDLNNSGRLNLIKDKELRYNLIAYYQYIEFVKVLDEEFNQSMDRMQEKLLSRLNFQDKESLKVPPEDVILILNYLSKKESYMNNYLSHRKICQTINSSICQQIETILKAERN